MAIFFRPARREEWAAVLTVHQRAIHEIACVDYPQAILDVWHPPAPVSDDEGKRVDFDQKIARGAFVVVAEIDGCIAGFGEIVPAKCELQAVYVNPDFKRRGVGQAILAELERVAREKSVPYLQMDSSLTAEPFYLANGYRIVERGLHTLGNGAKMACVKMRKEC